MDADKMVLGIGLLFATGAIVGWNAGFKNGKKTGYKEGFEFGKKKRKDSLDYIDGYENGCRDMDKFWQGRLKKMGFLH